MKTLLRLLQAALKRLAECCMVALALLTLADVLGRTGPVPVLIERDNNLPPLADLLADARFAQRHR